MSPPQGPPTARHPQRRCRSPEPQGVWEGRVTLFVSVTDESARREWKTHAHVGDTHELGAKEKSLRASLR